MFHTLKTNVLWQLEHVSLYFTLCQEARKKFTYLQLFICFNMLQSLCIYLKIYLVVKRQLRGHKGKPCTSTFPLNFVIKYWKYLHHQGSSWSTHFLLILSPPQVAILFLGSYLVLPSHRNGHSTLPSHCNGSAQWVCKWDPVRCIQDISFHLGGSRVWALGELGKQS